MLFVCFSTIWTSEVWTARGTRATLAARSAATTTVVAAAAAPTAARWARAGAAIRAYDSWGWLGGARAILGARGSVSCSSKPSPKSHNTNQCRRLRHQECASRVEKRDALATVSLRLHQESVNFACSHSL